MNQLEPIYGSAVGSLNSALSTSLISTRDDLNRQITALVAQIAHETNAPARATLIAQRDAKRAQAQQLQALIQVLRDGASEVLASIRTIQRLADEFTQSHQAPAVGILQ